MTDLTAQLPPRGPLGPLTTPTLIQSLCGARATGTLTLEDSGISKTLYLDQGRVVFATSTDPEDRLGQLYLRQGMISLATLKQAAKVALTSKKRMGAWLVEIKAIRGQDLIWGVAEQVRCIVMGLFHWTRGEYQFTSGKLPTEEVITLKVPTGDLIVAGIKSIDSWYRIEAAVGDLDTHYVSSPRFEELARELNLSLDEWTVLSRCESGASLADICEASAGKDFEVCRLIWAFMVVGLLQKHASTAQAATASGDARTSSGRGAA